MLSPKPGFSLNPEPWTFLTPSKSWTTSHGCSNEARSWFSPRRAATTPGPSSHIFHEVLSMHADLSVCDLCLYLQHLCRIHVFLYIYTHRHDKCVYGCVMAQLSVCVYVWVYVSLHLSNASTICCHTMLYYDAMFYYVMLYMVLLCCVARLLRLLYRAALFYTMFSEQYNVIPDCVMSCSTAFCSVFFYHMLWYDIRNS